MNDKQQQSPRDVVTNASVLQGQLVTVGGVLHVQPSGRCFLADDRSDIDDPDPKASVLIVAPGLHFLARSGGSHGGRSGYYNDDVTIAGLVREALVGPWSVSLTDLTLVHVNCGRPPRGFSYDVDLTRLGSVNAEERAEWYQRFADAGVGRDYADRFIKQLEDERGVW